MSYPIRTVGEVLPSTDALAAIAAYEGRVIDLPQLYSWLKAAAPNGSGVYADSSRRGNTWIQATSGNQPAIASNWYGFGINAFTFPNTASVNIAANFVAPVGDVSYVVLCDLHASSNDGQNHTFVGSMLSNSPNRYLAAQNGRQMTIFSDGFSTNISDSVATLATPTIYTIIYSAATLKLSVRRNGGTWTDSGTWNGSPRSDTTLQLGAYGATPAWPWYGGIAETLVFNCNLRATRNLYQLQMAEKMLAAKAGITLPY